MNPSPAFQFYPSDYLGSLRVQMMTLEEEGAYIRLMAYCWKNGSIPADPDLVARLIGKGASTTLVTKVLAMFKIADCGTKYSHERLDFEREKQRVWREKSSEGGKKSAEKRWGGPDKSKRRKGGVTTVVTKLQPPHQPNGNSSSSFSSSFNTNNTELLPFASPEFIKSWESWKKHLKEKRKPLGSSAESFQLKKLSAMGELMAIETIEHSISNNWQGLFPPTQSNNSVTTMKPIPRGV